jgi:hypothetical protein
MIFFGVDPDSWTTAWAAVNSSEILAVGVLRRKRSGKIGMVEMLSLWEPNIGSSGDRLVGVVEGQSLHYGSNVNPDDLFKLAHTAGAAAASLFRAGFRNVLIPKPEDWKGQVPKQIHQARVLNKFGILYEQLADYCVPSGCARLARIQGAASLNRGDWKHVVDAIGLARYGFDCLKTLPKG